MSEAPLLERKLAAILAADIAGYSRLMHDDEEGTLLTLTSHRAIIEEFVSAARGHICVTAGDGMLAEFGSVLDAVTCALAIQRALGRANAGLPPERRMELRIGINVGDVMVVEGDIFGDDVNLAARLEGLAEPGGICVTRAVRDQLRDRLDIGFDDMGEQRVKNIARPVRVFRIVFDPTLPAELPRPLSAAREEDESNEVELAFWRSVEASDQPADYLAYIERYPEGVFAALARNRLLAPAVATEDRSVELAFWDSVRNSNDRAMLQAYLDKYPDGEFRSLAEIRLQVMAGRPSPIPFAARPLGLVRAA